jgi:class 3 adenylate cyclase
VSILDTVNRAKAHLREHGRVSLRLLKREFELDADALDELVGELVDVQQVAVLDGKVLVWVNNAAPVTQAAPITAPGAADPPHDSDAGERRQLTVLFCDLVGSTPLSQQLDAEEWRDLIAQYQQAAAGAVARFGGHVAKNLGDGLLIYFGWPAAREDDPERAVRAGLAIVDAMARLKATLAAGGGTRCGPVTRAPPWVARHATRPCRAQRPRTAAPARRHRPRAARASIGARIRGRPRPERGVPTVAGAGSPRADTSGPRPAGPPTPSPSP